MSQQNKSTLQSAINTQIADNTSGDISAADVRDNLINITDSLLFNSGSQGITGSLTATSFTGSLQGTATTASYVETAQTASYVLNAVSASRATTASLADVATKISTNNVGGSGTFYPMVGNVFSGDANLYTVPSNYFYNLTNNQLFVTSISSSFTGSLLGTSTTASYVAGANVDGVVAGATNAVNSALTYTSKTDTNGEYKVLFTDNLNLDDNSELYKENGSTFTYNPGLNRLSLSRILADNFTGSLQGTASYATVAQTLLGSVTSASYAATASVLLGSVTSASYASTSSLSDETIGAGLYGGEIQFKGGTGPGSPEGKNTYSSAFTWNTFTDGLNIGDPLTTGGNGAYYLAVGVESLANGNYSVAFGSGSLASGIGSFTHGKAITAAGEYSHAEGTNTQSPGNFSHAEGATTTSWGIGSHAEGNNTTANGDYSHTEGQNAITNGAYSHAEGSSTVATGANSHAEGANTLASASFSHAEGRFTVSRGQYSHAEGFYTTASALYSHAEGSGSVALGVASHAEGQFTIASGSYQHVEGRFNTQGDSTSLLIIGNGTADGARSDAFKVRMSGSIVLPTTRSIAPSWTGTDGEIVPATVGGQYFLYMWMGGAWRSGSFV
jgi:hypothetical protein